MAPTKRLAPSAPAIAGEGDHPAKQGGGGAQASTRRKSLRDIRTCSLASSWEENLLQRKRSSTPGAPSTTVRSLRELQWSPSPASRGRKGEATRQRLDARGSASWRNSSPFIAFTLCFSLPSQKKKGGRTPTDADPAAALARGARSAERARLSAFHRGSHLRELFHPKGSASGQASWDAV